VNKNKENIPPTKKNLTVGETVEDAAYDGFITDKIMIVTHWQPLPKPPKN